MMKMKEDEEDDEETESDPDDPHKDIPKHKLVKKLEEIMVKMLEKRSDNK